jgi:hypothetical protein
VIEFTAIGGVATPSLISALMNDKGRWAEAVFGQCWGIPDHMIEQILSGAAECQIKNAKTLIIILPESQ